MELPTLVSDRAALTNLSDDSERAAAFAELPIDEPVPPELHPSLIGLLAAPEAEQRAEAVAVVARAGAPIVPLLLAVLADEGAGTDARRAAVLALGELGPSAHAAAWVLLDLADDPELGACARSALAAVEPPPRSSFPLLCAVIAMASAVGLCVALGLS
jgi:HEAT repeat protein